MEIENAPRVRFLVGWEDGELFVKSAQGRPSRMTYAVDMHQTSPVVEPDDPRWAGAAYHGTRASSA
eukprot:1065394-Alexandrium_andersonii.AAC.1